MCSIYGRSPLLGECQKTICGYVDFAHIFGNHEESLEEESGEIGAVNTNSCPECGGTNIRYFRSSEDPTVLTEKNRNKKFVLPSENLIPPPIYA